jgi:hypothetical protein
VRRNHHSKTDVVVTVVRLVVVAILGARVVLIVVPRAAAQHASTHPGSPCCCQPYDNIKKFRAALRAASGPRLRNPVFSVAALSFSGWEKKPPLENRSS